MASEAWSSNANEAVEVSLVRPGSTPQHIKTFNPNFTYPIFGEEESIFGYKNLKIQILFTEHDMRPNVTVSYDARYKAVGDVTPLDIYGTLREWLPSSAFKSQTDHQKTISDDTTASSWTPPGSLVHTYTRQEKTYEIWAGSLLDPAVRAQIDRLQIFISFFIEGGVPINLDDIDWTLDRWKVYFVYEKKNPIHVSKPNISPYTFMGYTTTYRFWTFLRPSPRHSQTTTLSSWPSLPGDEISCHALPTRLRISQLLVLPPFQHAGHASAMYQTIYNEAFADPTVHELTVEDPSEEFDKLRDANDWKVLMPALQESGIKINPDPSPPVSGTAANGTSTSKKRFRFVPTSLLKDVTKLASIRLQYKIAPRQFARLVEIYLLGQIDVKHRKIGGTNVMKIQRLKSNASDVNDRYYYWWRLLLKQRIYKKAKDQLQQIDLEDRIPKVEDAVGAVEDEYEGLLMTFAMRQVKEEEEASSTVPVAVEGSMQRKRKAVVDDEDEDDDHDGINGNGLSEAESHKKMKV